MQDVVLPTRLMGMMGAKKLLLTNAAGGVNPSFRPGDFMLITDHITTAVPSPLIGPNIEELGTRFPDMSEVYSKKLQDIIRKSAKDCGIPLQEGVYVQLTGPNYETPAEIRMVRSWGADAVGMSTACEAMAARHMGMEVCGISTCGVVFQHQNLWHILTASSSDTSVRLSSELSFLLPRFLLSAVFRLLWTHPICLNYCIQSVLLLPEALYLQIHTTSDMFSFSFFSPLFF